MRPLPEEKLPKKSRSAKAKARSFNHKEIRRLADRIISYTDVDHDNNANVYQLLEATRRQLLHAHFIRQKRKRKN